MSTLRVKIFLFAVIVALISRTPVYAYSYEDYLPPDVAPQPVAVPVYQSSSSNVAANQTAHAPVAHAGAVAPTTYQAQTSSAGTGAVQTAATSTSQNNRDTDQKAYSDNAYGDEAPSPEPARQGGSWYVSVNAAASQRPTASGPATVSAETASGNFLVGTGSEAFDFNAGPSYGLSAGYRISPYFRVEGEVFYSSYGVKDVRPIVSANIPGLNGSTFRTVSGGDLRRAAFLLNAYFDLRGYGPFVPYVGGGLGYGHLFGTTNISVNSAGTPFVSAIGDADTGIGMLEAGLDYEISDNWSITPSYRYLHYFGDDGGLGDETAHIFKMSARYSF